MKAERADESPNEPVTPGTSFTAINATSGGTSPSKKGSKTPKTPTSAGRKHTAPTNSNTASPRGIPKSWKEAGEADRNLYKMRDEGKDWSSIRKMWKDVTGEDTAAR